MPPTAWIAHLSPWGNFYITPFIPPCIAWASREAMGCIQASDYTQKNPLLYVSTFKSPRPGSRKVWRTLSVSATHQQCHYTTSKLLVITTNRQLLKPTIGNWVLSRDLPITSCMTSPVCLVFLGSAQVSGHLKFSWTLPLALMLRKQEACYLGAAILDL